MKKKIGIIACVSILLVGLFFFCQSMIIKADDTGTASAMTSPAPTGSSLSTSTPVPTATPVPTPTPDPRAYRELKIGKKVKKVYEVEGRFEKKPKSKIRVFRQESGSIYTGKFFLKGKHIYFAGKTGEIKRGWKKYRNNIYFFSRKNGRLTHRKKVEGVLIGKDGIVKKGRLNQERAETFLRAAAIVKRITKPSDTKSEKLYKSYKWVMSHPYVRHRSMKQMMKKSNWKETWDVVFANDIFLWEGGCCVSDAAAFALMAKECGYKKVTLCCDTGHSWDDIGGYLYDPLFAKARSFDANYHAHYHDYRVNPVITKKIS